jgi:LPS-assembly lipoprotein
MLKRAFLLLLVCLLSACGFHLRGQAGMPFSSIYLLIPDSNSMFVNELRRNLLANKVRLAATAEQADITLNISSEIPDRQAMTYDASGRVSEYQLRYRVTLSAYDKQEQIWMPEEELTLYRNFTYDDTKILAKESEEKLLVQSLRSDMVQQIVRRLSRAKPQEK